MPLVQLFQVETVSSQGCRMACTAAPSPILSLATEGKSKKANRIWAFGGMRPPSVPKRSSKRRRLCIALVPAPSGQSAQSTSEAPRTTSGWVCCSKVSRVPEYPSIPCWKTAARMEESVHRTRSRGRSETSGYSEGVMPVPSVWSGQPKNTQPWLVCPETHAWISAVTPIRTVPRPVPPLPSSRPNWDS